MNQVLSNLTKSDIAKIKETYLSMTDTQDFIFIKTKVVCGLTILDPVSCSSEAFINLEESPLDFLVFPDLMIEIGKMISSTKKTIDSRTFLVVVKDNPPLFNNLQMFRINLSQIGL